MNYSHMSTKQYCGIYQQLSGSDTSKVKTIIATYSHRWGWEDGESLIIDLLDDHSITSNDILEMLLEAIELDELNKEGRNAYTALKLSLKKQKCLDSQPTISLAPTGQEDPDLESLLSALSGVKFTSSI